MLRHVVMLFVCAYAALASPVAHAADYPAPKTGEWVVRDFRFSTGDVMPELKLNYTTIGDPKGEPVLILHGTGGSGTGMLSADFAGELFGAGQPLDAAKYFVILPDAIGAGKSSKPSDGMRAKFPKYNYDDMVAAHHLLVTQGLGIKRLRLVLGNSMGGMHTWIWGVKYPGFVDALVPMASQPTEMSSRNWMLRRLIIDSIRNDPDWQDGNYTTQPKSARFAGVFYALATNGGTLALQKAAPTREAADKLLDSRLTAPFTADANDYLYQWDSSRDYNPGPQLERIEAAVLAINSADDERNPPETGLMDGAIKRLKNGRVFLIPASAETRGHGTTGFAKFWKEQLRDWLASVPRPSTGAARSWVRHTNVSKMCCEIGLLMEWRRGRRHDEPADRSRRVGGIVPCRRRRRRCSLCMLASTRSTACRVGLSRGLCDAAVAAVRRVCGRRPPPGIERRLSSYRAQTGRSRWAGHGVVSRAWPSSGV
jgi:homoserine O-acetyltransferase/O-succinyltransferase